MDNAFHCCGILLAAGQGKRFDPTGQRHKLLQPLASGMSVVETSARRLKEALPQSLAIVASDALQIQAQLRAIPIPVYVCQDADAGMAYSIRTGLENLPATADAFLIVLADMPFVRVETICAIYDALSEGAEIVVPSFAGHRGNPVGFSRQYAAQLLNLSGDRGARQLLQTCAVTELALDDPGILQDIDHPEDIKA